MKPFFVCWKIATLSEFQLCHFLTLPPPSVDVKGVNDGGDGSKDSTEKIQLVPVEPKLWLFLPPSKAELVFARKSRRKQRVAKGWLPFLALIVDRLYVRMFCLRKSNLATVFCDLSMPVA